MIRTILKRIISNLLDQWPRYLADYAPITNCDNQSHRRDIIITVPSRRVGRRMHNVHKKFQLNNPSWTFRYFDNEEQAKYMSENWSDRPIHEVFLRSKFGQMKADIFRYCYLFDQGGVYLDCTKLIKIQLDLIFRHENEFSVSFESVGIGPTIGSEQFENYPVAQYCLHQKKNSIFMEHMIKQIEDNYHLVKRRVFKNPHKAILEYTGPIALMSVYKNITYVKKEIPHNKVGFDYQHSVAFSYPGSGYFKRLQGDYTKITDQDIC